MIGATVRPSAPAKGDDLRARILSAVLLVPAVLGIVYFGSPAMEGLVILAAVLLGWEWGGLCGADRPQAARTIMILAILAAVVVSAFGFFEPALLVALAGTLAAGLVLAVLRIGHPVWLALGVPYLAVPCIALLWLRFTQESGADLVLWLLLVIWATDSGAYFAGRAIGGLKLAPRISPNKTWAGFFGGIVAADVVAASGWYLLPDHPLLPLMLVGALVAALSQLGDLFESFAKRRFGVKDSGQLIPGHGGLLDRVDGLLVGVVAVSSVLLWRGAPS